MKPIKLPRKETVIVWLMLGVFRLLPSPVILAADQTQTVEMQLRDRLRSTMLELRTAETERATLQAAQAQCADEKKQLTERTEALTKQVNENKLTAQVVADLKSQLASQDKEIAQLKAALETERQTAELARKKEAEHAKLVDEVVIGLERLVVDRQTKNLALYKTANEILQRYEKFGLGDALAAKEPFIGITRVKLENLIQGYQDKLLDDRTALSEKDLESFHDKLLNQSSQAATPSSSAPRQTEN